MSLRTRSPAPCWVARAFFWSSLSLAKAASFGAKTVTFSIESKMSFALAVLTRADNWERSLVWSIAPSTGRRPIASRLPAPSPGIAAQAWPKAFSGGGGATATGPGPPVPASTPPQPASGATASTRAVRRTGRWVRRLIRGSSRGNRSNRAGYAPDGDTAPSRRPGDRARTAPPVTRAEPSPDG